MAAYEENYKAAQRVVEFIKAIGTVTKDSYDAIKRATDAYNALTPVQKALVPQWAIDLLEEATAKYDAELYFVRLADGKEYRPGEALPYSDKRNPIGHHMDIYPGVERDVAPLILGNIEYNVDDVLVMHWPQKVQSVSFR